MNDAPEEKLPENTGAAKQNAGGSSINALRIDNLHYMPNSLTELRRLAQEHPDLAKDVVDAQREAKRLDAGSERIGLYAALILALFCVTGAVIIVITLGWWQTMAFVLVMLGVSHLVRTVLTGEWSETSWITRFAKPKGDADPD